MPLSKQPKILKLEEMHVAEIGTAYQNRQSDTNFIDYIGEELSKKLEKISGVNFSSVLMDSSEDASSTWRKISLEKIQLKLLLVLSTGLIM